MNGPSLSVSNSIASLRKFFPSAHSTDLDAVFAVLPLNTNHVVLVDGNIHRLENLIHDNAQQLVLHNQYIQIASRLYFDEPSQEAESKLTDIQKCLVNCIYTRHHNGYTRQRRLESLAETSHYFTLPFMVMLLGEYVVEIIEVVERHSRNNLDLYVDFINENPKFWERTKSRIGSYWDRYYRGRGNHKIQGYIGRVVERRIEERRRANLTSRST